MATDITMFPADLGYYFPAEFQLHKAMWLSWPHKEESWPGKINTIFPSYCKFIKTVSESEEININIVDENMKIFALEQLNKFDVDLNKINFYFHPTNDAWCRDHGPSFLVNKDKNHDTPLVIVDWLHTAWGGKYPPYDLDDVIPALIAKAYNIPVFYPDIVMEGGAVDFNGAGTVLTSKSCLLNPNRNPHLNQAQIEQYLRNYYGVEQVLWVDDGIVGDDTDGHIDDTVRFVNSDTVLAVVEQNKNDDNYHLLQTNLKQLNQMRLLNGKQLNVAELPMPDPVWYEGQRLPASYANFYIANGAVVVPTYRCDNDDVALDIIQQYFPDREVVGIDSTDIIWGLGSFHCLSQQEPLIG